MGIKLGIILYHLTLNPSPKREGLKNGIAIKKIPFSFRRRGLGMRFSLINYSFSV
jgi:hypothetical protein